MHSASLVSAPVECVDDRDKVTIRHSEARGRGLPQPKDPRLEDGRPRVATDVGDGRPGRIDDKGKGRLFVGILLDAQRPDDANFGLGIRDAKSPDGKLELGGEIGEERKECHRRDVSAETGAMAKRKIGCRLAGCSGALKLGGRDAFG